MDRGELRRSDPEVAAAFEVGHRRMHGMVGVESGYSYAGSPLIADLVQWTQDRLAGGTAPSTCPS